MTWLALCDFKSPPYLNKSLGGAALSPPASPGRIANSQKSLNTGSLVAEVLVSGACNHAITLIEIPSSDPETIGFSIKLDPLRATTLTLRTPHARTEIAVKSGTSFFDRRMRLTYSWDCENASGLLTLENLEDGWLAQSEFSNPQPMPWALIEMLIHGDGQQRFGPELDFFGFSARIEPVGPTVSLARGTPIATPQGYQTIETLAPGDLVLTRDNGPQAIRWTGSRTVPAKGGFQPIRLCRPFFGLIQDILVAPEQRILIGGASIEYIFGKEELLVEARQLINGRSAVPDTSFPSLTYHHILLDNHEILDVAGAWMESLYAGDISTDPALLRTTLLDNIVAADIPVHAQVARPLLRAYEATTLHSVLVS